MTAETTERVPCANEAHGRPTPAIANLFWPDGPYRPTTACVGDMQDQVRCSIGEGCAVLVEPANYETAVTKTMKKVAELHRHAYLEPVRAILLEAPDHPCVDQLPETIEERRKLPARFHIPMWLDACEPKSWICAVCWDEGATTSWPCATAMANGGEVFTR